MKRSSFIHIFFGIISGAVFLGTALNPALRNAYLEVILGTAAGMFISWLIAAAVRENEILNNSVTPSTVLKKQ